jgi:ethanolamine ammonia-lyase small subunit
MIAELRAKAWRLAPIVLVAQGRVAIGDEIGELLGARMVAMLIGERPGLSSPDRLGIYLTYEPRPGMTDAGRNCISNVREGGLSFDDASRKLYDLMREARRRKLSGVMLKGDAEVPLTLTPGENFLVESLSTPK